VAISTYQELQDAVANWLHRSDLTSRVPEFITIGETRIFRNLRVKDMEATLNATVSSGVIATPTSYIDLKYAYVNQSSAVKLERKTADWIYQNYPTRSSYGTPKFIAREAGNFIFGPYPDSNYLITGVYYKNIGPVSTSAHAVFTANPDLYLFAALVAATPFLKQDSRLMMWEAQYQGALQAAQGVSDREMVSGGPLMISPG
jgi:hypothetical protein